MTDPAAATRSARWAERVLRGRGPAALRHRGFRQLGLAWLFTNLADSALYLMVAVWVKEVTGSDGSAALVFGMLGLPAVLAPFIGQLADRVSRKRALVVANMLMGPVVLTLLTVTTAQHLWLVYTVTFLYGAVGYLTAAAQSGLVRDLLTDEELAGGNGLLSTIDQALRLLSPLLGTALYVAAGPHAVVVLTAGCFAVTAVLLTALEVTETPPEAVESRGTYWREITAGFHHLLRTPLLGPLTVALALAVGATGLLNAAVFPVMEQGLGVDPAYLGALVSVQGIGAVAGGISAAWCIHRVGENRVMALGMVMLAVGMVPLLGGSLPAAVLGLVLVGAGAPWAVVAYVTLRQRLTPPTLQGRTAAASTMALNLPQTALTLLAAALLGVIDYRLLIGVTIAVVLASVVLTHPVTRAVPPPTGQGAGPRAGAPTGTSPVPGAPDLA